MFACSCGFHLFAYCEPRPVQIDLSFPTRSLSPLSLLEETSKADSRMIASRPSRQAYAVRFYQTNLRGGKNGAPTAMVGPQKPLDLSRPTLRADHPPHSDRCTQRIRNQIDCGRAGTYNCLNLPWSVFGRRLE